jgi:hypothetical protein
MIRTFASAPHRSQRSMKVNSGKNVRVAVIWAPAMAGSVAWHHLKSLLGNCLLVDRAVPLAAAGVFPPYGCGACPTPVAVRAPTSGSSCRHGVVSSSGLGVGLPSGASAPY